MADIRMTIYDPPASGLPFLAVMFLPDGQAVANAFQTYEEAEAHVLNMAPKVEAQIQKRI